MKKLNLKELNYKKLAKEILILIVGNLLLAAAVSFCFVNYHGTSIIDVVTDESNQIISVVKKEFDGILVGGTSGLSLILRNLFFKGSNSENVVETIITITTWALFFFGLFFLGKKFALQTLVSTILYPVFIYFFKLSVFTNIHEQMNQFDPVIVAILGGILMGVGCGIIYRIGGSTGGMDIPGLIINKYTKIKLFYIFFVMDGLLVVLAFVANFSLYEVTIGLIAVISYTMAVSFAQRIGNEAYYCDIISEKYEEINNRIIALNRGSTIVDVFGGYTGNNKKMIKTMVGKNQYMAIINIVKEIDPNAFMTMTLTHDVFGEGYIDISKYQNM